MDFGQEYCDIYEKPMSADSRIPFYMTYPMRNSFLEEAEYERDCRRLQEMYPQKARDIQALVSRECDKMEYEGSMMFDEYPDRLTIRLICRGIYRELQEEDEGQEGTASDSDPVFQMIGVMMMQEMYRRRCRYRRCRRWY